MLVLHHLGIAKRLSKIKPTLNLILCPQYAEARTANIKAKQKASVLWSFGFKIWRTLNGRPIQMLLCTVRRDSRRNRVQIYTFFWILTPFFNKVLYNDLYFNTKKVQLIQKKVPKTNRIPSFYTISLLTRITSYPPHKTTHIAESYAPHNLHCDRQKYSPSRSALHRLNGVSAWIDTGSAYFPLCWPLPLWGLTLLLQLSDVQPCSVQLCPYSANYKCKDTKKYKIQTVLSAKSYKIQTVLFQIENWELRSGKWEVKSEICYVFTWRGLGWAGGTLSY